MIVKILLIFIVVISSFMYLVILGASKNKTIEEIKMDNEEQREYLKKYAYRRNKNDRQNKKK